MGENARRLRFTGHIAGLGTGSGVRMVIGSWRESPFGRFADVMVEAADGQRILLAPTDEVAEFVSATYDFDSVDIGPIGVEHDPDGFSLTAPGLDVAGRLGGPAPFDGLLRLVPPRLATAPAWLRAIDPVASRLIPGCGLPAARATAAASITGCAGVGESSPWPEVFAARISMASCRWTRPSGSVSRPRRAPRRWSRSRRPSTCPPASACRAPRHGPRHGRRRRNRRGRCPPAIGSRALHRPRNLLPHPRRRARRKPTRRP